VKALGIVGSPRKGGNTEILTAHCLKAIAEEGLDTELVRLAGLNIAGCNNCNYCFEHDGCSIEDDLQPIWDKMVVADAIIVASPVYFGSATSLVKALLERAGPGQGRRPPGGRQACREEFYIRRAITLVPYHGNNQSRLDVLERGNRAGEGRGGEG